MIKTVIVAFTLVFGFVSCSPAPQLRKIEPDCKSLLSQSLPECQGRSALTYAGNIGEVWGEITVDVSSPVLFITEPEERKKKRKNKNKKKNQNNSSSV